MSQRTDQLPRIFQANLDRLFRRVIQPALTALETHPVLETGEAASLDQFLERARAQVDNYTANEAAKAFTLVLAATFERQLSIWMHTFEPTRSSGSRKHPLFSDRLKTCAEYAGIDLDQSGIGAPLLQMHSVANVVRHGDGRTCRDLLKASPELWDDTGADYIDLVSDPHLPSEHIRIRPADLARYAHAAIRFWGHADHLPNAVPEPPWPSLQ